MTGRIRVLVLDASNRVALGAVRALGAAGCDVTAAEMRRLARRVPAAFSSRHAHRSVLLPDLDLEEGFVDAVARLARDVDVVLPVATNTILALAKRRAAVERAGARFPFPPYDILRSANRKDELAERAKGWGVAVPETWTFASIEDFLRRAGEAALPAVVKLRSDEGLFLEPGERYRIARTRAELLVYFGELHARQERPLVQGLVEGDGYGFCAIARDGRVVRSFAHRRVREYPVTGGPSTLCESVREPALQEAGARVLAGLRWTGAAMVEFKRERATGRFVLLEVNPRLWGTLPLATMCGVNFPYDLCRMALGEDLAPAAPYRAGRRLRFLPHDAAAVFMALRRGTRAGEYALGFLRDAVRGVRDGIFEWADPRASLRYWWNLVRP